MRKIIVLSCILFLFLCSSSFALEKLTHERLNEVIAPHINESLMAFGFPQGVESFVKGKKIIRWIKDGGIKEDEPGYTRSLNHFHNPLKTWDGAGFKGTFQSSVIWAQDQGTFGSLWGGNFSWKEDREYFYTALTGQDFNGDMIALSQSEKENYFAKTFRGMGQVMHLVEDASVPAHTRNDAHVVGYHYELAVDKFRQNGDPIFTNAVANPITFNPSILSLLQNPLAPIPIARIFDTDKYDPANPDPNITIGDTIGLTEYSNANFVSEGLLSANFQDFPYPRIQDTTIIGKAIASPSRTYVRQYYSKNCGGETNAGNGYLLAVVDYMDYWRQKHPTLSAGLAKIPVLDDNVYKDYAALLIPRAVGYAAGLLEYFFRGTIEISVPQNAMYASTENKDTGFTRITLLAVNKTSNGDEMSDGTIKLVARYRTVAQDPFQALDLQASNDYFYAVIPEAMGKRTIPRGTPVELVFDLGQTAIIPINAVDVSLQVVYHGKLGNEDEAVAVGWKSISDPTPVELVNNMDKICLYGNWYDAGSQAAINQVDPDHDGIANWDIYPHDIQNIYVEVSPENNPVQASSSDYNFASAVLNAGKPMQNYILSEADAQLKYSYTATVVKTTTSDVFTHVSDLFEDLLPGYVVKSVVETSNYTAVCDSYGFSTPCTIRHAPPFYPFKDRYLWGPMTTIFDNPKYPGDTSCDWQSL